MHGLSYNKKLFEIRGVCAKVGLIAGNLYGVLFADVCEDYWLLHIHIVLLRNWLEDFCFIFYLYFLWGWTKNLDHILFQCPYTRQFWNNFVSKSFVPTILFSRCFLKAFLSTQKNIKEDAGKSTQMNTVKMSCLEVLRLSTNAICRSHLHKKGPFFLLKTKFRKLTGSGYSTGLKFIVKSFC